VTDVEALVGDLEAEQLELQAVIGTLDDDDDDWLAPTPAWGWDVRDTIAHLADTDEMAIDTARGGPYAINDLAARAASGADVTYHGVLRGRRLSGRDVAAWWVRTSATERSMLRALPPEARVPWGIGMRTPSFVTARLMETWAHGLDVRAAVGIAAVDTDRLAHVAWLATRALPYAYSVAGVEPPDAPLRVELSLPSGASWTFGPEAAADRISGSAGNYCRVFVHRRRAVDTDLVIEGDAARAAVAVARAFL
jgi:uncharacterized protein (TIGR03084 family)